MGDKNENNGVIENQSSHPWRKQSKASWAKRKKHLAEPKYKAGFQAPLWLSSSMQCIISFNNDGERWILAIHKPSGKRVWELSSTDRIQLERELFNRLQQSKLIEYDKALKGAPYGNA